MLQKVNRQLDRAMPVITPTSVIIGVMLAENLNSYAFLVPWIFAFMTFSGSLSSNFQSLKQSITHPFPIFITLFVLHLLMPAWAWGVGHTLFKGDLFTITGLILAAVIPTGITSFIWVSIYKGNIALTLSIILIDTFLAPFMVPYSLSLLVGTSIEMDMAAMMKGLMGMIVIPSLLGMVLNQITNGKVKDIVGARLAPFSKIGLGAVVMINGAVVAPYLGHIDRRLISIGMVVFAISFSGYLFAWSIGRFFKRDRDDIVALTFTGGMRNISAGAVLAVSYFPAPVAVPVVIGILFQQVLASFYGRMLQRHYSKPLYVKGVAHDRP